MRTCKICHFTTPIDDEAVTFRGDQAICLRCYGRLTGTSLPMPKKLRHAIVVALAEPEFAPRFAPVGPVPPADTPGK